MPDPKPTIVEIEDAFGNRITLKNGSITIQAVSTLELKAPTITLNGRVVTPNDNPI
jgi:hypothetical protein